MEEVIERTYLICRKCGKKVPFETKRDGKIDWIIKDNELQAFIIEHNHTQMFDMETKKVNE